MGVILKLDGCETRTLTPGRSSRGAQDTVREMEALGLEPSVATVTTLVTSFARQGDVAGAEILLTTGVEWLRENLADFTEKCFKKSRNLYQDVTCNQSI